MSSSNLVTISTTALAIDELKELLENRDKYTDVTFNINGTMIKVHSFILSAYCPVFEKIIFGEMKEKDKDNIVLDHDVKIFTYMIEYLYSRQIKCTVLESVQLFVLANYYSFGKLEKKCEEVIMNNINVTYAYDIYHQLPEIFVGLRGSCKKSILTNMMVDNPGDLQIKLFKNIKVNEICDFIEEIRKTKTYKEKQIFDAIYRWKINNSHENKDNIDDISKTTTLLFSKIDYQQMNFPEISQLPQQCPELIPLASNILEIVQRKLKRYMYIGQLFNQSLDNGKMANGIVSQIAFDKHNEIITISDNKIRLNDTGNHDFKL